MAYHVTLGKRELSKPAQQERATVEDGYDLAELLNESLHTDNGWWSPGMFKPMHRRKANWGGSDVVAIDLDTQDKAPLADADRQLIANAVEYGGLPWVACWHPTPHGVRLVGFLDQPVKPATDGEPHAVYAGVVAVLTEELDDLLRDSGLHVDGGSAEPYRAFYGPRTRVQDGDRNVARMDTAVGADGEPVRVQAVLACLRGREGTQPRGHKIGGGGSAHPRLDAARAAWESDHLLPYATQQECPLCGSDKGFHTGDSATRGEGRLWSCHSTKHAGRMGVLVGQHKPDGSAWGDALDLALHQAGLTTAGTAEFLMAEGYLEPEAPEDTDERDSILVPGQWTIAGDTVVKERPAFVDEVAKALPTQYQRARELVTVDADAAALRPLNQHELTHLVDTSAFLWTWAKAKKGGAPYSRSAPLTPTQAKHLMGVLPNHRTVLPIDAVAQHPILAREDEDDLRVCVDGYDAGARVYTLDHGLRVRDDMTPEECRAVFADLLVDYPFKTNADMQNAVSMIVTLFARPALDLAPMFYVGAGDAGTGKSKLLRDTLAVAVTGTEAKGTQPKNSEEEMRKWLDSIVRSGTPVAFVDNLPAGSLLESGSLAATVTFPILNMRILGETREVTARNVLTMAVTGNNVRLSQELMRRTVPVILYWPEGKPERRTDFQHPYAKSYAQSKRPEVISACMSAFKRWQEAGGHEPVGIPAMGSFEQWHTVVGGMMQAMGYDEFLGNLDEFSSGYGDHVRDDNEQLLQLIRTEFSMGPASSKPTKVIHNLMESATLYQDAFAKAGGTPDLIVARGILLGLRNSPAAGLVIETDDNGRTWYVKQAHARAVVDNQTAST
jgi:hypothetical protein